MASSLRLRIRAPAGPAADLRELLASRPAEDIQLSFRPYDWATNAKRL